MKRPCCEGKMKYKDKSYYGYPFSTGPEPDYSDYIMVSNDFMDFYGEDLDLF